MFMKLNGIKSRYLRNYSTIEYLSISLITNLSSYLQIVVIEL